MELREKKGRRSIWRRRHFIGNREFRLLWGSRFIYPFLTIQETDKAVIDVEAQDDGIVGEILVCIFPQCPTSYLISTVPRGKQKHSGGEVIALLAEGGNDISNLETPKEEAATPLQSKEASSSSDSPLSSP